MNIYYTGKNLISPTILTKEVYLCKNNFEIYPKYEILAGNYYKAMEIQQGPTVVINHIFFYCGNPKNNVAESRPFLYDYFCDVIEERKFKLNKINNISI